MNFQRDEVVASQQIYRSRDYAKFQLMKGNRPVDERHVKSLARKMEHEGNLMDQFPIIINEHFFVIDGQHRLKAAERNDMDVFYVIAEHTNLDTVIAINTDNRNWNWLNFAQSWAARENPHYKEFIRLYDEYRYNYRVLLRYCGGGSGSSRDTNTWQDFRNGDFQIKDISLTRKLLEQYRQLSEEAEINTREFAVAAYSYMRTPEYNHPKMVNNIRQYGDGLRRCYTTADFLLELDSIFKA